MTTITIYKTLKKQLIYLKVLRRHMVYLPVLVIMMVEKRLTK
jgi:hypothetical protein